MRGSATGRKNHYGSGSIWSGTLAAMMFTLLQTVLLWGLNPIHWLQRFLQACVDNGGQTPADLSSFLPWQMSEQRRQPIAEQPSRNRTDLSRLVCRLLGWYKVDGGLKAMCCRVAMLRMQDDGLIQLPPSSRTEQPKRRIRFTQQMAPQPLVQRLLRTLEPLQASVGAITGRLTPVERITFIVTTISATKPCPAPKCAIS